MKKINFKDNNLLAENIRKLVAEVLFKEGQIHRTQNQGSFDNEKFNELYNKIFGFDTADFQKIIGATEAIKRTHPLVKYFYCDLPEASNIPYRFEFAKNESKKHLYLIGVLNSCYMQSECIKLLYNSFKIKDEKKNLKKFDESHSGILKIRHIFGAHPIRSFDEKNVFHINSFDNEYNELWYFSTLKGSSPTVFIKKELLKFNNLCFKCLTFLIEKIIIKIRKTKGKKYDPLIQSLNAENPKNDNQ